MLRGGNQWNNNVLIPTLEARPKLSSTQRICRRRKLNEQTEEKKRPQQVQFEASITQMKILGLIRAKDLSKCRVMSQIKHMEMPRIDLQESGDMEVISADNLRLKKLNRNFNGSDEPTKKSGKRRKQMARKGLHTDLDKDDSNEFKIKLWKQETKGLHRSNFGVSLSQLRIHKVEILWIPVEYNIAKPCEIRNFGRKAR
ncbi:hypothetical protein Tco_0174730 [Tanacetum coccineum]